MPGRFHFTRRAAAAGAERVPAAAPDVSAAAAPARQAGRWTAGPGDQDDEWLHRNRRRQLARAGGLTTLQRPAVRAGSPGTAALPPPAAAAARRGRVTRDFSGVRAHLADPRQVPAAAHVERALLSPYARPPAAALEAARRADVALPGEIRVHDGRAAHLAAAAVGARAFTIGTHVVMGPSAGPDVLAHELVHVAQQADAARTAGGGLPRELPVSPGDSAFERAARSGSGTLRTDRLILQRDADPAADQRVYTFTLNLPPHQPEQFQRLSAHDAGVVLRNFTRRIGAVVAGNQEGQKYILQLHQDQWIVANVSDWFAGFISPPPLSIWDPVNASLSAAQQDLAAGNVMAAAAKIQSAAEQARAAAAKVTAYREGTETGAERAIFGLQIVEAAAATTITVGTGGTAGVLLGAGYAGVQQVAGQATAVHLGLQKEIDWAGIGFDTLLGAAMGFASGALGKMIAGRLLSQAVAKEAGAIARPALQRIVTKVATDVVSGRVGAVVQTAARTAFDELRGKENITLDQFLSRLAGVLTDPKGAFADVINGQIAHGVETLKTRSERAQTPPPEPRPPARPAPVTEPEPPKPAAPFTEPAPLKPAAPVTPPAPVTEAVTTPTAPVTEPVTTPTAPITEPVPEPRAPAIEPAPEPPAPVTEPAPEPPAPVTEPAVTQPASAPEPAAPPAPAAEAPVIPSAPAETTESAFAGVSSELGLEPPAAPAPATQAAPAPPVTIRPQRGRTAVSRPELLAAYEREANAQMPALVADVLSHQGPTPNRSRLAQLRQQFQQLMQSAGTGPLTRKQRATANKILREARVRARADFSNVTEGLWLRLRREPALRAIEQQLRQAGDVRAGGTALRVRTRTKAGVKFKPLSIEHRHRLSDSPWLYNDPANLIVTDLPQNAQFLEALRRYGFVWATDAIEDFVVRHRLNAQGVDFAPRKR